MDSPSKVANCNVSSLSSDFSCYVPFTIDHENVLFSPISNCAKYPSVSKYDGTYSDAIYQGKAHEDGLSGSENRTFPAILISGFLAHPLTADGRMSTIAKQMHRFADSGASNKYQKNVLYVYN